MRRQPRAFIRTKRVLCFWCLQEVDQHDVSPGMHVHLRHATGTVAVLSADADLNFSYVPLDGNFGADRGLPGYYALGDISMRIRYDVMYVIRRLQLMH